MINETILRPFPHNLFYDLGVETTAEQADDFYGTLMYVLRCVSSARDSRLILLRYKDGKSFDELGEQLNVSKQRAHALVQDILNKITGDYVKMLIKGIKKYYDDLFTDRITSMNGILEESERRQIKDEAYADGYNKGFTDGITGNKGNTISLESLDTIMIDTLGLSIRAYNALTRNGIASLGDIVRIGDELLTFRAFGKVCFHEIANLLQSYGVRVVRTFPRSCDKFEWSGADE